MLGKSLVFLTVYSLNPFPHPTTQQPNNLNKLNELNKLNKLADSPTTCHLHLLLVLKKLFGQASYRADAFKIMIAVEQQHTVFNG